MERIASDVPKTLGFGSPLHPLLSYSQLNNAAKFGASSPIQLTNRGKISYDFVCRLNVHKSFCRTRRRGMGDGLPWEVKSGEVLGRESRERQGGDRNRQSRV